MNDEVTFHPSPSSDSEYNEIYEGRTQERKTVHLYDNRHNFMITKVDGVMRDAIKKRAAKIGSESIITQLQDNHGFLIVSRSDNRDLENLADEKQWQISYGSGDDWYKPSYIRELRYKNVNSNFLTGVDRWTREFIIKAENLQTGHQLRISTGKTELRTNW